jgi:hypothetical protein
VRLGIMQPYFFPYIGYWQLMNSVDKYVIADDLNYIKNGWINRNRILINGDVTYLTLPLQGASRNKLINEIEVVGDEKKISNLLKTIEINYKKAPYYSNAFPVIERIFAQKEKNLAKFLEYSIREICKYLSINTEIIVLSSMKNNKDLKCQEKVLDICKILGAYEYYNAIGGQELYFYDNFAREGIILKFLKTENVEYKQFNDEFIPDLSIIDVMMFNSLTDIKEILRQYDWISKAENHKQII